MDIVKTTWFLSATAPAACSNSDADALRYPIVRGALSDLWTCPTPLRVSFSRHTPALHLLSAQTRDAWPERRTKPHQDAHFLQKNVSNHRRTPVQRFETPSPHGGRACRTAVDKPRPLRVQPVRRKAKSLPPRSIALARQDSIWHTRLGSSCHLRATLCRDRGAYNHSAEIACRSNQIRAGHESFSDGRRQLQQKRKLPYDTLLPR